VTTIPDFDLTIAQAAVARILADSVFQNLVLDGYVGTDAEDTDDDATKIAKAWVFHSTDDEGVPPRDVEGSGTSCISVDDRGDWAISNKHNTMGTPRLRVMIYADATRASDGSVAQEDGVLRCKHVFKRIDRLFHNPLNRPEDQRWLDDFYVHASVASSIFEVQDVPKTESGSVVRGERTYECSTD
jgi:hypothetical protein